MGDNFSCSICNTGIEETVEHLFFHGHFSRACWNALGFPISDNLMENTLHLVSYSRTNWRKHMSMDVFSIATWGIWKERNNFYFIGITPELSSWKARFKEDVSLLVHRTKEDRHPFI